jgi:hypothetical protein
MAIPKKMTATVRREAKGRYTIKLPKRLPKRQSRIVVDAIPVSVVVHAEILADGTLKKASVKVKVTHVSKGIYNLEFIKVQGVRSIAVQPQRKPHSWHVIAVVRPTTPTSVTIVLMTTLGTQVDRPFKLLAILGTSEKAK